MALGWAGCKEEVRSLRRPNRLCLGQDERIYVSDFHHNRIVVFDADGRFLEAFGKRGLGPGQLWQVQALFTDGPHRVVLVNKRIFSPTDESLVWEAKVFERGREQSAFSLAIPGDPTPGWKGAITRGEKRGFLVTDEEQNAVLRYDASGRYLGRWPAPRGGGEPFKAPGMIHRRKDAIWLVECNRHRVRRLTPDGRETLFFGREGRGQGELRFPSSADTCPGQWVAVADMGNYRIQRFDLAGNYIDGFAPKPAGPRISVQLSDLRVSGNCKKLYLVDSKGNRVLVTTPTGEILQVISGW